MLSLKIILSTILIKTLSMLASLPTPQVTEQAIVAYMGGK